MEVAITSVLSHRRVVGSLGACSYWGGEGEGEGEGEGGTGKGERGKSFFLLVGLTLPSIPSFPFPLFLFL